MEVAARLTALNSNVGRIQSAANHAANARAAAFARRASAYANPMRRKPVAAVTYGGSTRAESPRNCPKPAIGVVRTLNALPSLPMIVGHSPLPKIVYIEGGEVVPDGFRSRPQG